MRKFFVIVCTVYCACQGLVLAQGLSGRFVTSFYGWQRQDSLNSATSHLRGYENVQLDFGTGNIAFHTYMQGSTDLTNSMENDPQLRLFNMYLSVKNIADLIDLKIGRQAIFAGVSYGSIDGALVRVRPHNGIEIMAYGGGLTPPSQRTDFFQNFNDNWQLGGQVLFYLQENTKIGLSYMNRHRESTPFTGYRPDAQLGLLPTTIDYGSRANQYASIDAAYGKDQLWLFGRCDYDFNFEQLSRAEVSSSYQVTSKLGLSLNLAYRQPTIAYNSYFSLFELEADKEAVLGVDYTIDPLLTLMGRVSTVLYEDETAYRVSIGAANSYASLIYTKDVSYDGDLNGLNAQVSYPFLHGKLLPHVGVIYSSYALADNLDKTSTWAAVFGAMVRPMQTLSFDIQGQYMTNKIYKSDMRVFARINYWFAETFGSGK